MLSLWSDNYIPSKPIERAMKKFAQRFNHEQKVLDIGCGRKPYQNFFTCRYIELDHTADLEPDIVAPAWNIPFPDNNFDGIILNQTLEHIANINQAVAEIKRVLKPNGYAIVTVPQTMKNHSLALEASSAPIDTLSADKHPYWQVDYYRFTKYGLAYTFKSFSVISLYESNGYFGSIFQLTNYFFASLNIGLLPLPIYLVNNILGLSLDFLGRQTRRINHPIAQKFYHYIFTSLTINLIMIIQKPSR